MTANDGADRVSADNVSADSVSVVIATHNRVDLIERMVRRILEQEYPHFELIVVDDGSTDDTVRVLRAIDDPRLTVLESNGIGANPARNFGARSANGAYLVFADDDDDVRPGWLSALMDTARATGSDLVSCGLERVDREWKNPVVVLPKQLGPIFAGLQAQFLPGAFAIRARLFEEIGGYPITLPSNQQTGLALRVAIRHESAPVTTAVTPFVGVIWHQRRRGAGGVPASFARNRLQGTLVLLDEYPERFARDPAERANYLAAAATCAARLGQYRHARWLYLRAYRSMPARRRDLLRILLTYVPPMARRTWPVIWDDEPDGVEQHLRILEVVQDVTGSAALPARVRREVFALAAGGHTTTVVTNDRRDPETTLPEPRRVVPVGPRSSLLRRSSIKPIVLGIAARRLVRRDRPDLVIAQHPVPAWIIGPAARRAGIPMIAVVRSLVHQEVSLDANPHRRPTSLLFKAGERRLRHATIVAPVSDSLTDALISLGVPRDRIELISNPVDTDRFRPSDEPRDIDVLYVGRLSPEKGPQDLLDACLELPPQTHVVIAGSGRMRADLEKGAAAASCTIEFTGFLSEDELARIYRRARVVVIPSHTEALPNVALEAMASGVPVVATRVGGLPTLIDDGTTGWLVEPRDVQGLREAIERALASDLTAMGAEARRRAEASSADAFRQRLLAVVHAAVPDGQR